MKNEIIQIEGMSCNHCVMAVKKELSKLDLLIKEVSIGKAEVDYDPNKMTLDKIYKAIEEAGYKAVN
ncbi:MAG: copper chaperone [Ignavibacteriales bacterium]|nr:MAG: copper chaperone [Ignavibacteriales bacterium]